MSGESSSASPWLVEQIEALRATRALGPLLDLACGRGRQALPCARAGLPVLALDRDLEALRALRDGARGLPLRAVRTDLESGHGIPVAPGSCGAVLVFRFLFRPLCDALVTTIARGGLLLYETFTRAQPELGWGPRRPAFLLEPGELPTLFPQLEVLAHWEGVARDGPRPEACARLLARRR